MNVQGCGLGGGFFRVLVNLCVGGRVVVGVVMHVSVGGWWQNI